MMLYPEEGSRSSLFFLFARHILLSYAEEKGIVRKNTITDENMLQ